MTPMVIKFPNNLSNIYTDETSMATFATKKGRSAQAEGRRSQ
jgi:hypothetical protein